MALPHFKADRAGFLLGNVEISRAREMLNDPSWTKAVFFRNPLERLVSAYQDKILRKSYTQKVFNIGAMTDENRTVLSFSEFVDKVTTSSDTRSIIDSCTYPTGLSACTDPHWKPQLMTCGLDYLLPKFDFVGNFDYVAEHTKALLEKVGVWETWGQRFDDDVDANTYLCRVPPPIRRSNDTIHGFNQRGSSVTGPYIHRTESRDKLDEFYTPDLIDKVRKAYALDFLVWDEISKKSVSEVSHGKELRAVQEYCSAKS
jgi:hypothetical protein